MIDRGDLRFRPLAERANRVRVPRDLVQPGDEPRALTAAAREAVAAAAADLRAARASGRARVMAFGAHAIKNGLAPVLIRLMERGWLTHLATNGAGIIHDWELAWLGQTSEDVRANVARGEFGMWQETGYWVNLAINVGAWRGLGYGESVGSLVAENGLVIPEAAELARAAGAPADSPDAAARAADLLSVVRRFGLAPGRVALEHRWGATSVAAAALRLGVPFTGHPMFGHDIIYAHPMNHGASIGRTAERDFLRFAASIGGPRRRRGLPLGGLGRDVADDLREVPVHGPQPRDAPGPDASRATGSTSSTCRNRRGTGPRTASRRPTTPPTTCDTARPSAAWAGASFRRPPTTATSCSPSPQH